MNRPFFGVSAARCLRARIAIPALLAVPLASANAAITTVGDVFIDEGRIAVAAQLDGSLTLTPPDAVTTNLVEVAISPGVVGSLTIDGAELQADQARIAPFGVGDVVVKNNGRFRVFENSFPSVSIGERGVGTLTVTGAGSSAEFSDGQQFVGTVYLGGGPQSFDSPLGRGVIRVQDGASLRTGMLETGGGVADVTVEGVGSTWRIDRGASFRDADVAIRDGARVLSQESFNDNQGIAFGAGGVTRATISGSGTLVQDTTFAGIAIGAGNFDSQGSVSDAYVLVEAGADVNTRRTTFLAQGSASDYGTLELTGDGTTWTTEDLILPDARRSFGVATILIRDGAVLRSGDAFGDSSNRIGRDSRVEIDGARSRWDSGGASLSVAGTLAISGGARHSVSGIFADSGGEITVVGPGSELAVTGFQDGGPFGTTLVADGAVLRNAGEGSFVNNGDFTLDNGSIRRSQRSGPFINGAIMRANGVIDGTLLNAFNFSGVDVPQVTIGQGDSLRVDQFDNEALVSITGGELRTIGGFDNFSTGVLELNDALVTTGLQREAANDGRVEFTGGDSTIEDGLVNTGTLVVAPNATARILNRFSNFGDVEIGASGRLILDGDVELDGFTGPGEAVLDGMVFIRETQTIPELRYGGDLTWESSAQTMWSFTDVGPALATVGGDATLDGLLSFSFTGRFEEVDLEDGLNSLLMIDAASVTGEFTTQLQWGEQLFDRVLFRGIDYTDTTVSLLVEQIAAGDLNGDGEVTWEDHDAWVAAYGTDDHFADGNGDGVVDAADYTLWRDAYSIALSTNVPEPTAIALVLLAAAAVTRRR